MCLIGFALDAHDDFVLLLAANRDEYYAREADPAAWWTDRGPAWGGRDRVAGGSWLAVDRNGRLAAVTNVREPGAAPGRRSRGELVAGFVGAEVAIEDWAAKAAECGDDYSGFNLLLFDPAAQRPAFYVSNRHPQRVLEVPPGVHGLSNHALADRSQPPDEALPDTGIGLARERILAPAMIVAPGLGYGTRASTLVAIRRDGRIEAVERGWTPDGESVRIAADRRARFNAARRIRAR